MGCDLPGCSVISWNTCSDMQSPASGATGHPLLLAIAHGQVAQEGTRREAAG